MAFEPPVAVYDACVLYPFHLRNVLIQCAFDGLVEARWTDDIHAEWIRNLVANSPGAPLSLFEATREKMKAALPDADVADYQALIPSLSLPAPNDRHVLAAAIAGKASVIVTWNVNDFPPDLLQPHDVVRVSPDDFLVDLHAARPSGFIASVKRARHNLRKTEPPISEFIDALDRQGLTALSATLRQYNSRIYYKPGGNLSAMILYQYAPGPHFNPRSRTGKASPMAEPRLWLTPSSEDTTRCPAKSERAVGISVTG